MSHLSLFRVIDPTHRYIALLGSPSGGGGGSTKAPRSVITIELEYYLQKDFMKKLGAEISLYPKYFGHNCKLIA